MPNLTSLIYFIKDEIKAPKLMNNFLDKFFPDTSRKWLRDFLANVGSFVFLVLLVLRALTHLDTSWDSLAYHLPFAARLANIYPANGYIFTEYYESIYAGVPALTEWAQGWLWRITGFVSAANLVGLISILLVVVVAVKALGIKFWMAVLFFFSIPLVSIHSVSSYNDLPCNSFISIAFINLVASYEKDRFDLGRLASILIPLSIAANMKYQAILTSGVFFVLVILVFLYKNKQLLLNGGASKMHWLFVLLMCSMLFGGKLLFNLFQYKNPFYPLASQIGPVYFEGPVSVGLAGEAPDVKPYYRYLISLSELKMWTDNRGSLWSIDMWTSAKVDMSLYSKTGGYFVANLILWTAVTLVVFLYADDKKTRTYTIFVLASFVVVGFLPVSYYLRYWMFLPINLAVLTLLLYVKHADAQKPLFHLTLMLQVIIFAFVIYQIKGDVFPRSLVPRYLFSSMSELYAVPSNNADNSDNLQLCVASTDTRQGFLYKLSHPGDSIQFVTDQADCISSSVFFP